MKQKLSGESIRVLVAALGFAAALPLFYFTQLRELSEESLSTHLFVLAMILWVMAGMGVGVAVMIGRDTTLGSAVGSVLLGAGVTFAPILAFWQGREIGENVTGFVTCFTFAALITKFVLILVTEHVNR